MAKKLSISFSDENLSLYQIHQHYSQIDRSIGLYFDNPTSHGEFTGMTLDELKDKREEISLENDRLMVMNLLAALEAAFRIDYLQRVSFKKKDDLSKRFREMFKKKAQRASLEDDILDEWKRCYPSLIPALGDLKSAFKYRHWLAHGRYWVPKLGRNFDYFAVYALAQSVFEDFPFETI